MNFSEILFNVTFNFFLEIDFGLLTQNLRILKKINRMNYLTALDYNYGNNLCGKVFC